MLVGIDRPHLRGGFPDRKILFNFQELQSREIGCPIRNGSGKLRSRSYARGTGTDGLFPHREWLFHPWIRPAVSAPGPRGNLNPWHPTGFALAPAGFRAGNGIAPSKAAEREVELRGVQRGAHMIIGIPKESWEEEKRVALTPVGVYSLTREGHEVHVQAEAGSGSGFSEEAYAKAGAKIVFSAEEVFGRSNLLVKVWPPTVQECGWMPEHSILFSMLNLGAASPKVHEILRERRMTAVGLEVIEDAHENLPVLTAMSEIAGMLLPQIAGRYLETTHGGRGIMLGGVAGIAASRVVIIGAGTVGTTAACSFRGSGANMAIMDEDLQRLRRLELLLSPKVNTVLATPYNIDRYVTATDVVVGAILIHRRKAPHVVTEDMVRRMRKGSVILDVSIDQGGCVETSRPTTLSDPVFQRHGVTHYCVPNIPSSVARTASHALNNALLTSIEEVAESGLEALRNNLALRNGVYLYAGSYTHEGLAGMLGEEATPILELFQ